MKSFRRELSNIHSRALNKKERFAKPLEASDNHAQVYLSDVNLLLPASVIQKTGAVSCK